MKEQCTDQSFHMGLFAIKEQPWGQRGVRLEIFYDGEHIGEYERTHYSKRAPRLQDKKREVYRATPLLVAHARTQKNGKVAVRFTEGTRRKEIRAYDDNNPSNPGLGPTLVGPNPTKGMEKDAMNEQRGNRYGPWCGRLTATHNTLNDLLDRRVLKRR